MIDEPSDPNAFGAAMGWLVGVITGNLASTVAVIALASIGLLLLSGRIEIRRGIQVILGCFILFGASTIAAGIMQMINGTAVVSAQPAPRAQIPALPQPPPTVRTPQNYDPYAGAAVPAGR